MRILSLELTDVRRFRHQRIQFGPGFNLLVGENGAGKSTALRSLMTALGHGNHFDAANRLSDEDIRHRANAFCISVECETGSNPRRVEVSRRWGEQTKRTGGLSNELVLWFGANESVARSLQMRKTRQHRLSSDGVPREKDEMRYREEFLFDEEWGPPEDAESTRFGRSEDVRRFVGKALASFSEKFEGFRWRFIPYECVVHAPSVFPSHATKAGSFRRLVAAEMMKVLADQYPERRYRWGSRSSVVFKSDGRPADEQTHVREIPEIAQILKSVAERMEVGKEFGPVTVEIRLTPRIVLFSPEGPLLLSQLSDGEKRIFSMIVDIAREISLRGGGWRDIGSASALVVIDEIDCHLHPRWQRIIVKSLEELFPACQFIAATHSPFVIQAVRRDQVINLDEGHHRDADEGGNSIEDIVEDVQGVVMPQRSQRAEELSRAAERYFKLLRLGQKAPKAELQEAELQYRMATEPFTLEPGLNALLKVQAIAARTS